MEQEQQGERSFVWYCDIVVRGPSHLGVFWIEKPQSFTSRTQLMNKTYVTVMSVRLWSFLRNSPCAFSSVR